MSNHSFQYSNKIDKGLYGYTSQLGTDRKFRQWIAPGTIERVQFDVDGEDGSDFKQTFTKGDWVEIFFVSGKQGKFFIDDIDEFRIRLGWHLDFMPDDFDEDDDDGPIHKWRDKQED